MDIPIFYNVILSVISLLCGIIFSFFGYAIATRDKIFQQISNSVHPSITKKQLFYEDLSKIGLGSMITAFGIVMMHYLGTLSTVADVKLRCNFRILVVIVLVAVISTFLAFWIAFRLCVLHPNNELLRICACFVACCGVCGIHYLDMQAVIRAPSPHQHCSWVLSWVRRGWRASRWSGAHPHS